MHGWRRWSKKRAGTSSVSAPTCPRRSASTADSCPAPSRDTARGNARSSRWSSISEPMSASSTTACAPTRSGWDTSLFARPTCNRRILCAMLASICKGCSPSSTLRTLPPPVLLGTALCRRMPGTAYLSRMGATHRQDRTPAALCRAHQGKLLFLLLSEAIRVPLAARDAPRPVHRCLCDGEGRVQLSARILSQGP